MKTRQTFVSNSSSSSFICDLCNRNETGMDISLEEAGMIECIHGHVICEECLGNEAKIPKYRYEVDEELCPVCQFVHPSMNDMSRYFEGKYKISRTLVFEEIKKLNRRRKKLYNSEYVQYVLTQKQIDLYKLLAELKEEFKTYGAFLTHIRTNIS